MSTQVQTNRIVPRSIVRHRPIAPDAQRRSTRRMADSGTPEIPTWQRRTPHSFVPQRGTITSSSEALAALVACGMGIALLLIALGPLVVGWTQTALDDLHYGRPRVSQIDAFVGHEQAGQPASHFLALNNRGRVEIIELPGNDAARARIFLGPQLTGTHADLVPVTVRFVDPHHTHYPDMIIQVQATSLFFHNTHDSFVLQPGASRPFLTINFHSNKCSCVGGN